AGSEDLDALVAAPGRKPCADVGIVEHPKAVLDTIEQSRRVEHLKARLETDPESVRGSGDLDGAECYAFDHRRKLAELIRRIDVHLDLAGGALLDTGLHPLEILVGDVVDSRLRQLHGELLRVRGHGS